MSNKLYFVTYHNTGVFVHTYNLWNNLTAFFYIYHITNMQIQPFYDVGIMERSTLYHGSGQLYRIQIGHRSHSTCSPHLIGHLVQAGKCLFGLKLVCNGPSGWFCRKTQITLLSQRIHFQYYSIRSYRQILTLHIPVFDKIKNFLQCFAFASEIGNFKSPFLSFFQIFIMTVARQIISK